MRVDDLDVADLRARQRLQAVDDVELHLAGDGEVVIEEQIVVAMDRAADRVLERDHAVRRRFWRQTASNTSSKLLHGSVSACGPP